MISALTLLSGCTSLFFHPTKTRYPYLELDRLNVEKVELRSKDGTKLMAWYFKSVENRKARPEFPTPKDLKPNQTRGLALQFHGNAQNISSHYRFLAWLLYEGWDVMTFDYRGYGDSEGDTSDLKGLLDDGITAIEWAESHASKRDLPIVIFGQSLGGNLSLRSLVELDRTQRFPKQLKLLVIDSSFYSFTSIAREKLSDIWFLWPFQWLGWALVSNTLSAGPALESMQTGPTSNSLKQTQALFLHSLNDPVVSNRQGEKLYASYPGPKERWTTAEPGHVNILFAEIKDAIKLPPGSDPELWPIYFHREKLKAVLPND